MVSNTVSQFLKVQNKSFFFIMMLLFLVETCEKKVKIRTHLGKQLWSPTTDYSNISLSFIY